ncbi:MAG: hypothetical protein RLP09_50340 [Sandaracinaceae bacterium]
MAETSEAGAIQQAEVPVDWSQAGIWQWTLVTSAQTFSGHVIVRGGDADPIGAHSFGKGEEVWYLDTTSTGGTASFEIELLYMRDPDDTTLLDAVDAIVEKETEIGTADMVPTWKSTANPNGNLAMFTLVDIDGPGSYSNLYEEVSMQFVDPDGDVPTWYSSSASLYSIFGGSTQSVAVAEGTIAYFDLVNTNDPGYPNSSWYWYGRDPNL